jgi:hypothetical protein
VRRAFLLLPLLTGCGGVYYGLEATGASSRLEEARTLGAESLAPYEYYYAKAHMEQAQVEASQGHYSDAALYAETAGDYASEAIDICRNPGAHDPKKKSSKEKEDK